MLESVCSFLLSHRRPGGVIATVCVCVCVCVCECVSRLSGGFGVKPGFWSSRGVALLLFCLLHLLSCSLSLSLLRCRRLARSVEGLSLCSSLSSSSSSSSSLSPPPPPLPLPSLLPSVFSRLCCHCAGTTAAVRWVAQREVKQMGECECVM